MKTIILGKCLHTLKSFFKSESKDFFHQALKYSSFIVFAIASLVDIKRDNLTTKDFQKCFFAMIVLGMTTVARRIFRPQNTQVLRYLLMPRWEKSRVAVSEQFNCKIYFALKGLGMYFINIFYYTLQQHIFRNIFCNRSLRYVSTLRKKVFSTLSIKFFFFRPQNTWILLFLLKLV